MKLIRLLTVGAAVVAGTWILGANTASAQWGYGGYRSGHNHGYSYRPSYGGYGYGGYSGTIHLRANRGYWHDTSHWDYHPGQHVRHGNHYHYIPGHYDWHQQGHWHRH